LFTSARTANTFSDVPVTDEHLHEITELAAGLAAGPMPGFDAPGIDAEFFAGRPQKTILVVNIGKPGPDPWFDRLPRLAHEDYVEYV
jgi:nitroreductase